MALSDEKTHESSLKNHAHHDSTPTQKSTNGETLDDQLFLPTIILPKDYQNLSTTTMYI